MFTKGCYSLILRFLLAMVLLSGAYGAFPIQKHMSVYALGETPGTLDSTFDSDGLVTTSIGNYDDEARAVAIQTDGKIVVAGRFSNPGYDDFFVIRYNEDGSLDTSFDSDGIVTTDFGGDDIATAMAIQDDGKIVVAGYSSSDGSTADLALARYNTNGSLDTSFDTDGKLITSIGAGYDLLLGIAIQSDGKIVVIGGKDIGINDYDIAVLRYNTNGSLDTTFDSDGVVITAVGSGYEIGVSIAIQQNGDIVVGGATFNVGTNMDFVTLRYKSNGSLDTSFDTDGIAIKDFGIGFGFDRGGHIAIQPDGKIIVAGYNDEYSFLLMRYNSNGSLDTTFDADGLVATYMGSTVNILGVALQENGKIVIVGYYDVDNDFVVARYNANGTLDTSFDSDGKVITDFGSNQDDLGNAVAIQADGKIIVAGYRYIGGSNYDVAIARYIGDEVSQVHLLTVTKTADTDDGVCDSDCSLREAIANAGDGDTITFDSGLSDGTIHLLSTLTLSHDVTIDGSSLTSPITVSGDQAYRVFYVSSGVTATLDGLIVALGHDIGGGSGIYNTGSLMVMDSTFVSNGINQSGAGGGIFNAGILTVANTTFYSNGNAAESDGGGIYSIGTLTVTNSTFSYNGGAHGGGIYNNGILTVTNSTFSNNGGAHGGGGIYNTGTLNYTNTIIANSTSSGFCVNAGTIGGNTNNLVEDGSCSAALSGDPLLGPLTYNGGPTQTMALLPGSPAINAGNDIYCPATDQRGVSRPKESHCDIGAYELVDSNIVSYARDFSTPFVPPSDSAIGMLRVLPNAPQQAQSVVVDATSTPAPEWMVLTSMPQPLYLEVVVPTSTPEPEAVMSVADVSAPETTFLITPGSTSRQRSTFFAYESTEAGTFLCSLDGSAYFACEASIRFTGLSEGTHLFEVRAVDEFGNYDATPAIYTWVINKKNVDIQRYKTFRK